MSTSHRGRWSRSVGGARDTRGSRRLAATALVTVVVAVVGLSAWGSWLNYRADRRSSLELARTRAATAAQAVDRYLTDQLAYLASVAKAPPVLTARPEAMATYLRTVLPARSSGLRPELGWLDAGGQLRVLVSDRPVTDLPLDLSAREYVQRVRRERRPAVSGVLLASNTGAPVVVLATPTFDDRGTFAGVLAATISLKRLSVIGHPTRGTQQSLIAVDRFSRLVFGEQEVTAVEQLDRGALAALRSKRGVVQTDVTDLRGRAHRLIAAAEAPVAGWTILSNESMDQALGGARRRLRDEWIAVASVGLLGGLLSLGLLGRLDRIRRGQARQSMVWQETSDGLLSAPDSASVDGICAVRARELLSAESAVIAEEVLAGDSELLLVGERAAEWEGATDEWWKTVRAAMEHGQPSALQRRSRTAKGSAQSGSAGFETVVVCPLERQQDRSRVLLLGFRSRRSIASSDLRILEALSNQCSLTRRRLEALESEAAARDRLERLNRVSSALAAELDEAGIVHVLLREGIAAVRASRGSVYRREPGGDLALVDGVGFTKEFLQLWRSVPADADSPLAEAVRTGKMILLETPSEFERRYPSLAGARVPLSHGLAALPLRSSGRTLGVLGLSFSVAGVLSPMDTELLGAIADLGAQALDRSLAYEAEHRIADRLQRALLTTRVPQVRGFEIATCYRPAVSGMEIGGDWWDVLLLDEHRLAVITGDVVGRGLEASATMGQLRSAARALAKDAGGPARLLERLDGFVETLEIARFTTIACAEVNIQTGEIVYACAGHPPPLVVGLGGQSRFLNDGRSTPLGLTQGPPRTNGHAQLRVGEVLVLYTDGLIERRSESLDIGLARLKDESRRIIQGPRASDAWPDAIADALVEGSAGRPDDVCVITVGRTAEQGKHFSRRVRCEPSMLRPLRQDLTLWLQHLGVASDRVGEVVLACGEACSNAVEHAYYGRASPGYLQIDSVYSDADDLLVEVRDFGSWRVPPAPGNRGRGRAIMEAIASEFELDSRSTGTTVKIRIGGLDRPSEFAPD